MTEHFKALASSTKVSDDELIRAIWLLQVRKTARGCVDNYAGDYKSVTSPSRRRYAQGIPLINREKLGVNLSKSYLRKRLVLLINKGVVQWSVQGCSFWIDGENAQAVFDYACDWWSNRGVPSGFDKDQNSMRCMKIEGFNDLSKQLEKELVALFGMHDSVSAL